MRIFVIAFLLPLAAQEPPKPAEQAPAQAAAAAPSAASPVPSGESWLTGSMDLGYRWRTDVGGSFDTYRSIVNLGAGPKLLGTGFTLSDPKHRVFDQIRVRAYSWGDDPYSTFHLDAGKSSLYSLNADYRDFAYFNFLPSFADPLLSRGVVLNEQAFDTRRRFGSFSLDVFPGRRVIPYVAYDRDSGSGTGVATFVSGSSNEYPVPNRLRDLTNLYRGGVRFELKRFHATLEQGGTTFKDDQSVFKNDGPLNFGNVATTVFGQRLDLASLLAAYGIRGSSVYSKVLVTSNPASWLDVYGQFLYSQPDTTVHYQQAETGNLFLQSQLLFYNSEQFLLSAAAKLPHTTANLGAEIRPFSRLRIVESWLTDRLHNTASASSSDVLSRQSSSQNIGALLASSLVTNYNQQQIDVLFDAPWHVTLRGGYRYVWGDAHDAVLPAAGLASSDRGQLRRNVGIGGLTFRPNQKLSVTGEVEGASSSGVYFRTSLYDYQKVRAQARYQISGALSASADFILLNNQNPVPGVHYDYLSTQEALSLFWSPAGGKRWDLLASYSRSGLRSDISYLEPEILQPRRSFYRENAHVVTALFNGNLPHYLGLTPRITAGGSFFISSGSRPTSYYQPLAKIWVPLQKRINWFTEWRYYGYGEAFYVYEGFRTHLVTTGLRFSR